jgi:hypothetical protein
VTVEELVGLSLALNRSPERLIQSDDDGEVMLPSGFAFPSRRLAMNDGSVTWKDDQPVIAVSDLTEKAEALWRRRGGP